MYKNIYVYDKSKYFAIFLKRKLANCYNVKILDDIKLMNANNFSSNDIGIFIANNVNDLVSFFRFKDCFKSRIIVCTDNIRFAEKYQNTFKLSCIDISKPKKKYYEDLINNIYSFGLVQD